MLYNDIAYQSRPLRYKQIVLYLGFLIDTVILLHLLFFEWIKRNPFFGISLYLKKTTWTYYIMQTTKLKNTKWLELWNNTETVSLYIIYSLHIVLQILWGFNKSSRTSGLWSVDSQWLISARNNNLLVVYTLVSSGGLLCSWSQTVRQRGCWSGLIYWLIRRYTVVRNNRNSRVFFRWERFLRYEPSRVCTV